MRGTSLLVLLEALGTSRVLTSSRGESLGALGWWELRLVPPPAGVKEPVLPGPG